MIKAEQQENSSNQGISTGVWLAIALAAHTGWGANPVFTRFLQVQSQIPTLALIGLGSLTALLVLAIPFGREIRWRDLHSRLLWILVGVTAARALTNIYSARYTLAIYVQLINLLTPFAVVVIGRLFFRTRVPSGTGPALIFATIGSLMMLLGGSDEGVLAASLTTDDWIGISLALISTVFLAFYFLLIRRTAEKNVKEEVVLLSQVGSLGVMAIVVSILGGEDWSRWQQLGGQGWLIFGLYAVGVLGAANVGQIGAIRRLGAPVTSALQAWRLIAALVVAYFLLGEQLTTLWQAAGALLVVVTVTIFLIHQHRNKDAHDEPAQIE